MKLGVVLALGESFTDLKTKGQDQLMITQNISSFAKSFKKVFVFTYKKEKVLLPKNVQLIVPPFNMPRYLYGLVMPLLHRKIFKDLSLIRCFQLSGVVPGIIAKLVFRTKIVFNFGYDYSAFAKIEGKPIQALIFSILKPIAFFFTDHILVKNKSLLPAISHKPSAKFTYIPNGVDIKLFKPARANKKNLIVLFVGRLEPQKNLLNLIKAVAKVKSKPQLILIGEGSQKITLAKLAKKLEVNLKLPGKVNYLDLPKHYHRAALFVLPSIKEGSPKALLEAMASQRACIASNIAENREIITHRQNGLLSANSTASFAKNINLLLRSASLRQQLANSARKTVVSKFSVKKIMDQELKVLNQVANK